MLKSVDCLISVGGGKEAIKLTHKSFSYDEWTFFFPVCRYHLVCNPVTLIIMKLFTRFRLIGFL